MSTRTRFAEVSSFSVGSIERENFVREKRRYQDIYIYIFCCIMLMQIKKYITSLNQLIIMSFPATFRERDEIAQYSTDGALNKP